MTIEEILKELDRNSAGSFLDECKVALKIFHDSEDEQLSLLIIMAMEHFQEMDVPADLVATGTYKICVQILVRHFYDTPEDTKNFERVMKACAILLQYNNNI